MTEAHLWRALPAALLLMGGVAFADISETRHNLSVTGTGSVKTGATS